MNQKEISELRRRFRPEYSNITTVRGCYVSDRREILSQFTQSIGLMLEDEKEKLLGVLKKTLSGTLGKNLMDISFATQQVVSGEEHKLLMRLRDSALKDDDAAAAFFEKVSEAVSMECNYLILLAYDAYDVPYKGRDGLRDNDGAEQVFQYITCCVCPVKLSKSALSYHTNEAAFHNSKTDWIVAAPEMGFLFPAFDSRATNLYGALYYTRSLTDDHAPFIDAVFSQEPPMPAAAQKETFQAILGSTLEQDCSLPVVQSVHAQISTMVEEYKASGDKEPLLITKPEVNHVLLTSGVSEDRVAAFGREFDAAFGEHADLSPQNLVDTKRFLLTTPEVKITVDPEHRDLIETRVLGGAKYILIRAEDGVEVNGVPVHID